jgi:hypothetical protein
MSEIGKRKEQRIRRRKDRVQSFNETFGGGSQTAQVLQNLKCMVKKRKQPLKVVKGLSIDLVSYDGSHIDNDPYAVMQSARIYPVSNPFG